MERVTRLMPAARDALPTGDFRDWAEIDAWSGGSPTNCWRYPPRPDPRSRPDEPCRTNVEAAPEGAASMLSR